MARPNSTKRHPVLPGDEPEIAAALPTGQIGGNNRRRFYHNHRADRQESAVSSTYRRSLRPRHVPRGGADASPRLQFWLGRQRVVSPGSSLVEIRPDWPPRMAALKSLPPHQFVARAAGGKTRYLHADPTIC